MVDQLANDYASQPVVFLEYNASSAPPERYDRWWAAFGGSTAYYPMAMVDSGHQVKSGYTTDLYNIYKGMVDAELARVPLADIEAYSWRVDNHVKFSGQMTNRSGQTLSTARNDATLHALVYEDAHVGVTNRFVRAVVSQPISADLLSGSSISFYLETPDLTGVNWTKLHMLVLADYRPNGSSGAYDMLQAALTISPTSCTYTILPTSASFSSSGNTGTVAVTTSVSSCSWSALSNNPSWITITAGSAGTGNGTVAYSVSANRTGSSRTGTMNIGGQTFTVTQNASCTYTISPTSASFSSSGSAGTVAVTTSVSSCSWSATSNASWITITAGSAGNGNGTVSYFVSANTTGSSRTGTMNIAGRTFTVTQNASCAYTISPTSASFSSSGSAGTVAVTTSVSSCSWSATSNASWITITAGSAGTGNGTVNYEVSANRTNKDRTGTITVAGKAFTITQKRMIGLPWLMLLLGN